jgi:hypothetical protein
MNGDTFEAMRARHQRILLSRAAEFERLGSAMSAQFLRELAKELEPPERETVAAMDRKSQAAGDGIDTEI